MNITRGASIDITNQLTESSAKILASWIGGYTVIKNQKTLDHDKAVAEWIAAGKPEKQRPIANAEYSYLAKHLEFLKEIPCQIRRNAGAQWFAAHQAFVTGLRGKPVVRAKRKKRNCYVTNELFVVQHLDENRCVVHFKKDATQASNGKFFMSVVMPFSKDKAANSLFISRKGQRFWVSMSHEKEIDVPTEREIRESLVGMTDQQILDLTEAFDAGVANQLMGSNAVRYHFTPEEQAKIAKKEAYKRKCQKRFARTQAANDREAKRQGPCKLRKNGTVDRPLTQREKKWLEKAAKQNSDIAAINNNRSHHISKGVAENAPLIAVFEDNNYVNMRAKPKAKQCPETGKWLRNGAAAKRGLNRALATVNPGQIRQFSKYKLAERGKLMLLARAAYSSQECHACHHIHADNRKSQSLFVCEKCQLEIHADLNASKVLKQRVIQVVRDPAFLTGKKIRKTALRKKSSPKTQEASAQQNECVTAYELTSSGCGETVSPPRVASFVDAPKFHLTCSNASQQETRPLYGR